MSWRNSKECVVSENSFSKNFWRFSRKTPQWNWSFKQSCRLPGTNWECSSGKFMKFSEQISQEMLSLENVSTKIYFQKISHSIYLIYVLIFNGMCSEGLNIWIRHIVIFWTFTFKVKAKKYVKYSSFIQNISVFTKDFKNHKMYFKPLISGKKFF